jgi:hypothetical protein
MDTFFTYALLGEEDIPKAWFVRALLSNGDAFDLELIPAPTGEKPLEPRPLGAADADGDGRQETFVVVDHGASTEFFGIFAFTSDRLIRVEEAGKGPLRTGARWHSDPRKWS